MALRPQPVSKPFPHTTSRYQGSNRSTAQKTAFSTSSDSDDLEILGIKTWKGKAVFTKLVTKRDVPPAGPASTVNDLANQLIDLTVSPAPSKSSQDLLRPRGIPRFTSPSARTAFSPTKKTAYREQSSKPIHPFFKPRASDRDRSRPETHNLVKATTTFKKPQPPKQQSTGSNPFLSPPGSPTLSSASGDSTPVRPPPPSQRPRLAPPSSSSSSGSPSLASSSFGSTYSRSRSPSPSKPLVQAPASLPQTSELSKTSPLRVISPTVRPNKSTAEQKSFKPTFNPTQSRAPPGAAKPADLKNPSIDSPWKWTKWGWTQEKPKSPTRAPTVQVRPVKASATKKGAVSTVDPLITSMQNLGLEKAAVEGGPNPVKEEPTCAPQSAISPPVDTARPTPPAAPLRTFSHKTYHIGNPIFTKPPTLAYTADPTEANELLSMIQGEAIAFDMEWPFTRGKYPTVGKTALIQVGDEKLVVLIHLSMMKTFPSRLREMLEDPKIYKLGVNVIGDAQKLVRENAIYTQGILDLSDIARAVDAENCRAGSAKIALAKLCAQYIGFELDKGAVRTSNWSKRLSQEQMNYAADDVYSTTMIYNSLMHIGKQREITVDHAALSINLSPEMYAPPSAVLKDATGVKSNTAKSAKGIAPSKMRAFGYFNEGKSVVEIGKAMRSDANPLMPNTVRGYLLDVVTSDAPLEYDKQRMYDLLSEDVHPVNYQRNKAFLAKLLKQLGKQIPRSPPAAKSKNLVSSDVELSQETHKAGL